MPRKIDLYYFGDAGKFDKYNPLYLYKQKWAPEILFEIANSYRYELSKYDIASRLDLPTIDIDDILSNMKYIGMVLENQDKYAVSFTTILEKDLSIIDEFTGSIALKLSEKIISKKQELKKIASKMKCLDEYGYGRVLYHVIGCDILDGTAIDEFGENGILKISKPQFDNRDYILIGFEDSTTVSIYSNMLLCSRNCIRTPSVSFVSFGDANGNRHDLFRFIKQVDACLNEVTANRDLNLSYIHLLEQHNQHLAQLCANVVSQSIGTEKSISSFSDEEKDAVKFLEELQYVELDESGKVRIIVPLFDVDDDIIIGTISSYLISIIMTEVAREFSNLKNKMGDLTSVLHGIDEKEIANELWHQVFGNINEYLVKDGLISTPEHKIGEGRYFQALYLKG